MPENPPKDSSSKWLHPNQVLQLHRLKAKKKALQARIQSRAGPSGSKLQDSADEANNASNVVASGKRRNPFVIEDSTKKQKLESVLEDTSDQTLFKLLRLSNHSTKSSVGGVTDFNNVLQKISAASTEKVEVVKAKGESWIPVDWALKTRIRFLSAAPFSWSQKLKISEEASGITGFTRCLDSTSTSSLDTSPNAKFHQCCLFWQQPFLPWLNLFPRTTSKAAVPGTPNLLTTPSIKESLQSTWADSFRSVFQLIRTKQCPYFYVCANTFTVLFRAGGICGFTEMHAMITPTTRGLRQLLRQEEIEFRMPLKSRPPPDQGCETADSTLSTQISDNGEVDLDEDEQPDDEWMQSMGLNAEDIRRINYTQAKISNRVESKVDNSEESLVLVEGMEVHALYNFLMNCKSAVSITGPFAGVPPTILAPVAFHGATLNSLKVRESKLLVDDVDYYSLDIIGPILPSTIHNLCLINPPDSSLTATFSNVASTIPFSKIESAKMKTGSEETGVSSGSAVFGKENLSDCGLNSFVLKKFCSDDPRFICNVECLKYTGDTKTFTWT